MKYAKILGFLGFLVVVFVGFNLLLDLSLIAQWAGPLTQNPEEEREGFTNTSDELTKCSSVILQIKQASTDSVTVLVEGGSIDKVSATWFYEQSAPVQAEGVVTNEEATLESDNPGELLNSVEVSAPDCEGTAPVTYP